MTEVFVVCAAIGATVLILQFLMSLFGLGGDHDLSHDFGGDHDFSGGDAHVEVSHDGGDSDGDHDLSHDSASGHAPHGAMWLVRALSLRTVITALAFFGLSGLAAQAADCSPGTTLLIAAAAGLASMYAVYYLMCGMKSLHAEGTARIQRALGKEASVYLRIPGNRQGHGKIQVNLQNRTVEYLAVTAGDAIPTGAAVIVTEVLGSDLVQVQPLATRSASEA